MRLDKDQLIVIGEQLVEQVKRDDVIGLAAELAFRAFLALFPFFIFLAALGGSVAALLGVRNPAQRLVTFLGPALPSEVAGSISGPLQSLLSTQDRGLLSLGIAGALLAATSGTNATIKAMNRAYDVPETRPFWKRYLMALGLTLLVGILLVAAFALFMLGDDFGRRIAVALGLEGAFQAVVRYAPLPLAAVLLLLTTTLLYWAAPNMDLVFKWVLPGAVLFTLGWLGATSLLNLYIARFDPYRFSYGALGGVAVLLVWFYLTTFILLVGAELNAIVDEIVDPDTVAERREQKKRLEARRRGDARGRPRPATPAANRPRSG